MHRSPDATCPQHEWSSQPPSDTLAAVCTWPNTAELMRSKQVSKRLNSSQSQLTLERQSWVHSRKFHPVTLFSIVTEMAKTCNPKITALWIEMQQFGKQLLVCWGNPNNATQLKRCSEYITIFLFSGSKWNKSAGKQWHWQRKHRDCGPVWNIHCTIRQL